MALKWKVRNKYYWKNVFFLWSDYPENTGKSGTAVPPVERFSPIVDMHQFMLGCN